MLLCPPAEVNTYSRGEKKTVNAIEFLIRQHREIEELFVKLEGAAEVESLLEDLARKLSGHMAIEEEVFYPAVYEVDCEELHHAMEEHDEAKVVLDDLMDMNPGSARFKTTLADLRKQVMHHVREEERDLFPKVRKATSAEELEELYFDMQDLLEEIEDQRPGRRIA